MSRNAESVIVRASVSALEYHEAAWEAHDSEVAPPDPTTLSDPALSAILRYEARDMPAEAFDAVRAERRRRTWARRISEIPAFGVLVVEAVSGVIIAWFLLVR
jgi:hypothetical protein